MNGWAALSAGHWLCHLHHWGYTACFCWLQTGIPSSVCMTLLDYPCCLSVPARLILPAVSFSYILWQRGHFICLIHLSLHLSHSVYCTHLICCLCTLYPSKHGSKQPSQENSAARRKSTIDICSWSSQKTCRSLEIKCAWRKKRNDEVALIICIYKLL